MVLEISTYLDLERGFIHIYCQFFANISKIKKDLTIPLCKFKIHFILDTSTKPYKYWMKNKEEHSR